MALSFGRRKPRGEAGGHGGRCRHFHVHYHLPRKRDCTFSLLRWLPRLSVLSCVLIPLALFFAVLAFVVSFVWFTLLYFVASLLNKGSDHGSFKNGSLGGAGDDVDNRRRGDGVKEGNLEAKEKAVEHAAELPIGDSATAEASAGKPEIKEVHIDGFSQASRNITRIASSDASLDCEVRTNSDKFVQKLSIFEAGREGMHADADLEEFCGRHEVQDVPVDGFVDEHNIGVVSRSPSRDPLPSAYSINSVEIHDLLDTNEVVEMSSGFLVGSNQNVVVPSNTSCHHHTSDINEEYGEDFLEDTKELSDCAPYEIIDFIDKHETRDQALDGSFGKDEIVGLLTSSDSSAHGIISPGEHNKESTEEKHAESVPELLIDSVPNLEHFDEQRVPDVSIIEANAKQSAETSNEAHDFSKEDEPSEMSLYAVCEDTVSSDASSHHEDDKQEEEAIGNSIVEASDPESVACDCAENQQTAARALDDSVDGGSTGEVVSQESSEDEADKVNDDSSSEGAPRGRPLLRRSPSHWWNLCGVVDVFAGSED